MNKKKFFLLMISFLLMGLFFPSHGQEISVSGKVTDATGFALPGVSVIVKGTTLGTTTDIDGNYKLLGAPSNGILVFSFVGMSPQEISINSRTVIDAMLKEDISALEEVVVIGYGTVKKKDATGAVDAIGTDDFTAINATSPAQMLRGKVSGVQVTQSSGEPGGAIRIRVRGNSSVRSGNEPLIVIDGIPLSGGNVSAEATDDGFGAISAKNPLNFISENDIESINILKDASSTAIYGSRGANGVIVITTKKGKTGPPKVNFNSTVGISEIREDLDMMSSRQYIEQLAAHELLSNDHGERGYKWTDILIRDAFTQSNDMDISFGGEHATNRISIGTLYQDGIIEKTGIRKYTVSFANNSKLLDIVTLDINLLTSYIKDESQPITKDVGFIGNLMSAALYWNPTRNVRNADGSYTFVRDNYLNPLELLNSYYDVTNTTRILGSVSPTVDISKLLNWQEFGNLTYKFLLGIDYSTSERSNQLLPTFDLRETRGRTTDQQQKYEKALQDAANLPEEEREAATKKIEEDYPKDAGGYANIFNIYRFNKTFENTLSYDKEFEGFGLKALLGYSYYSYSHKENHTKAELFHLDQTNLIHNLEGGKSSKYSTDSKRNETELQSFFGRLEGSFFENRLLITASIRTDGSTRPGHKNRYDYFPAVGIAYKIFDNTEGIINNLKIRSNWGITGNQEFDPNSALAFAAYENGRLSSKNNSNKELKWETTTSYGVGIDFDIVNRKLSGSLDYYYRETEDLIFPTPTASSVPGAEVKKFKNMPGTLKNQGVEAAINYNAIDGEDLSLSFNVNAAYLTNKMTGFDLLIPAGSIHGQGLSGAYVQVIANNESLYSYYMREWRGFDANGKSIYADADGNDVGPEFAAPKLVDKSPLPKVNLGFNIFTKYKNVDFNASFYGAFGHYIYNNTANALFFKGSFLGDRNVPLEYATANQVLGDPNSPSTRYLEKGDYLKLSNITIGYTFSDFTDWIRSVRIFASGSNLFTITDYSGFDPEVDTDKTLADVPSAGIDYFSYPSSRTITLGVNVSF